MRGKIKGWGRGLIGDIGRVMTGRRGRRVRVVTREEGEGDEREGVTRGGEGGL